MKYIVAAYFILSGAYTYAHNKPVDKEYFPGHDSVPSYTNSDVWTAYDAFNRYLFDSRAHLYKVNADTKDGADTKATVGAIWTQAIYWDMAMNAYKRAAEENDALRKKKYKKLADEIYRGDSAHYVHFNWHDQNPQSGWFIYDDIMWWSISFARAYGIFKDPEYLKYADQSFCRVWHGSYILKDRGSYDKERGGMFWNWNNSNPPDNSDKGKMSCINFPTVIAAATLYRNIALSDKQHKNDDTVGFSNDPAYPRWHSRNTYLKNAKEIYSWAVEKLFDKNTGKVADSRHGDGVDWNVTLYNQGTFIGASCLLYKLTGQKDYLDNAVKAADYAMNKMCAAPLYILPYKRGEEQGIYTAIFAQYMNMLVYDCGQTQYLEWLRRTAGCGWSHRDGRGLTGKDYTKTPASDVSCYDASGIPALMLLFPAGN